MLLKGFDFGAGLALGEASPGAFGAVACPAWFDELEPPVTLEPFFLVLSACAFETCCKHALLFELTFFWLASF